MKNHTNDCVYEASGVCLYEKSYKWARTDGWNVSVMRKIIQKSAIVSQRGHCRTKNRTIFWFRMLFLQCFLAKA